ncbi:divergent PAP2 family protein [Nanoarchaeota archaeon]
MIKELLTNQIFISVMITILICEIWKFIDHSIRNKKVDWGGLVVTGGMPSSHATWMCAIAVSIGLLEGFTSSIFFLAAGITVIVVRDAFGVRRDVDKLAETVNSIIKQKKLSIQEILKITGHSPVQVVVGIILGIAGPVIIHFVHYAG